jgi:periplasmic divalent cation tolerance protein
LEAVEKTIRELHSYKVPEIIALPVVAGGDDYLGWLDKTINEANTK